MKKTFDQLVAEGKRKRAERLRQVRGGNSAFNSTRVILPDGTMTPFLPLANWTHRFFEESVTPNRKRTPDDNAD